MKDKSQIGKCHICGTVAKLSCEHVPPQKAFNNQNVKMFKGSDFKKVVESKSFYWEYPKLHLKYSQKQSGVGWYTLCESCNNNTGSWYADALINFYYQGYINIKNLGGNDKLKHMQKYPFIFKQIYLLRIIKEILVMFCSINPIEFERITADISDIKSFILNRNATELDSHKYALYIYAIQGTIARFVGDSQVLQRQVDGSYVERFFSECTGEPFGFLLEIYPKQFSHPVTNIFDFAKYDYDSKVDLQLDIPVYECNSMYPSDYRTKEEIEEESKKNWANNTSGFVSFLK